MHPAVLDTFFLVTERPGDLEGEVIPKRETRFYEHIDTDVLDGFLYFYSVTAGDAIFDLDGPDPMVVGEGFIGQPHTSFAAATPGYDAVDPRQWANSDEKVIVYPNPATRESLDEFQKMSPNEDDPTGIRIAFANLPAARNTIRIFTLAGDHLANVEHDGRDGYGQASWNLVTRNGQQVVSGIYLFVVESEDPAFGSYTGKFVVIW
jgi:hypothetical protein